MQSQDWGHATSIPPSVNARICSDPLNQAWVARNDSTADEVQAWQLNDTTAMHYIAS